MNVIGNKAHFYPLGKVMSKIENKAESRGTKYTFGEVGVRGVAGGRSIASHCTGWFIGMLVFLSAPHLTYKGKRHFWCGAHGIRVIIKDPIGS